MHFFFLICLRFVSHRADSAGIVIDQQPPAEINTGVRVHTKCGDFGRSEQAGNVYVCLLCFKFRYDTLEKETMRNFLDF